jgi:hypothetical protein
MEQIPISLVRKGMSKTLSDSDILNICGGNTNLIRYQDMKINKVRDINDVLGEHGACVILYEMREGMGHWICVLRRGKDTLEFFDSYGNEPDGQSKFVKDKKFKKKSGEDMPILAYLMKMSKYKKFIYNKKRLQKLESGVNTCGRFCALRIKYRDVTLNRFAKILRMGEGPDFNVTLLTLDT